MSACACMAALALALALALPAVATADSYTVGTAADPAAPAVCPTATAPCSLRQIVGYIHTHPFPPDTITVPARTYTLNPALGEILINDSVSIVGAGARSTVIAMPVPANRLTAGSRIFNVEAISGGATPDVSISGVELTGGTSNGATPHDPYFGGDVRNSGRLTLTEDFLTNGSACSGGGVANDTGTLTVVRSLIAGNHGACGGGDSGAVLNHGAPASSGPPATPDQPGHVVIDDSTITANDARLDGAILSWGDATNSVTVTNSTIAGNAAQNEPGGGVRSDVPNTGGLAQGDGAVRLQNSIVAGNVIKAGTTSTGSNCQHSATGFTSLGHNVDSGTTCGLTGPGDLTGTDPLLGPVQNNGGPTDTLAIPSNSPAVDRVPPTGAGCPATDQRGVTRPQGPGCDIGAFELQVPPTCTGASATTAAGGSTVTVSLPCTESAAGPLTLAIASAPAHGGLGPIDAASGTVSYTPAPGYSGIDTFTYTGADSGGASVPATITITVPPAPPPPPPPAPACGGVSVVTAPGGSTVTISLACSDAPAAGPITYALVAGPAHGTLRDFRPASGAVTYTPRRGFSGTDAFTYTGTAAGKASTPATVTITVPPPLRLTATMSWGFGLFRHYNTVVSMIVNNVVPGARVFVTCSGRGCRHRSHTAGIASARARTCARATRCAKAKRRPGTRTVDLTRYFKGWHLAVGSRLTVAIVKPGYVGKAYIFTMRGLRDPSVRQTCLAPGSSAPGRGC